MASLNFDITCDNRNFIDSVNKIKESVKNVSEFMKNAPILDFSGSIEGLKSLDEVTTTFCENMARRFGELADKARALEDVLNVGEGLLGKLNSNTADLASLRAELDSTTEELHRLREENTRVKEQFDSMAQAIKDNDLVAIHELKKEAREIDFDEMRKGIEEAMESFKMWQGVLETNRRRIGELKEEIRQWVYLRKEAEEEYRQTGDPKAMETADEINEYIAKAYADMRKAEEGMRIAREEMGKAKEEMEGLTEAMQEGSEAAEEAGEAFEEVGEKASTVSKVMTGVKIAKEVSNAVGTSLGGVAAVMKLYGMNAEAVVKVQEKVVAVTKVLTAVEQVYEATKKGSAIRLAIEHVRTLMLAKARGVEAAATEAATAAQVKFDAALIASGVGAFISLLGILAMTIYTVAKAFFTSTEEEKRALTIAEELKKVKEEQVKVIKECNDDIVNSTVNSVAEQIVSYRKLQSKWNELGNDLKAKEKFVHDNADAFHKLGVNVDSVTTAENFFVKNTSSVVEALMARARAAAYEEKYKESVKREIELKAESERKLGDIKFVSKGQEVDVDENGEVLGGRTLNQAILYGLVKKEKFSGKYTWTKQGAYLHNLRSGDDYVEESLKTQEAIKLEQENQKVLVGLVDEDNKLYKENIARTGATLYDKMETSGGGGGGRSRGGKNGRAGTSGRGGNNGPSPEEVAEKQREIREKMAKEEERSAVELEYSTRDAVIKAKEEGTEKILAQINLDYDRQIDSIEKNMKSMKEKRVAAAKQLWDADPGNKGKDFYTSDEFAAANIHTQAELANQEALIKAATVERDKRYKEALQQRLSYYRDYVKEYGTIEQQRYAIAQEWEEKIANAPKEAREKLRADMKKEIENFDINLLKQEIDWEIMFDGVGDVLYEEAKASLDKVEEYMRSDAFKKLDATEQQSLFDMRNVLRQKTGSGVGAFDFSVYGKIGRALTDYQQAVLESKEAHRKHTDALTELEENEKKLASATTIEEKAIAEALVYYSKSKVSKTAAEVKSADAKKQETKNEVTDNVNKAKQALDNFGNALQQVSSGSLKSFADGIINIIHAIKGDSKSNGLSGLGKAGGIIAAVLTILDMLGDDPAKFFEDLFARIGDTIETLLQQLFTDIVPTVIEGVLHLVESVINGLGGMVSNIFGEDFDIGSFLTGSNAKEVAETTKDLTKANEKLASRISDLAEVIGKQPIAEAMYAYDAAMKAQKEYNKNAMDILKAQMGYHGDHHSNNYYMSDSKIRSYNADAQMAFQAAGVTASTINGLSSIYNLTPEQLKAIKDFAPDLWKYLTETGKYDKSEYWEAVVANAGETERLTESINKNLTSTTFDSVYDSFKSSLSDMDKSAYDFSRDFEKYMFDAMLSTELDKQFKDRIKGWYEAFAAANKDGSISTVELASLRTEWENISRDAVNMREQLRDVTGYGSSVEGQGTYSAAKTFTQEQGDILNGRLTAIQMNVRENNLLTSQVVATLEAMRSITSVSESTNTAVLEIRNMMVSTNSYLETVARYSKATYTEVADKLGTITQKVREL